jgi:Domain of unknown function (DUF5658)
MILAACTRFDTGLTIRLEPAVAESLEWMRRRRLWLAGVALGASVLDLVLTQTILTLVADRSGAQPAEANPIMASVVMTWWAWPLRVGVPALVVSRDLRTHRYGLITTAAALYGLVVVWNLCLYLSL